jgi:hypothetical protein
MKKLVLPALGIALLSATVIAARRDAGTAPKAAAPSTAATRAASDSPTRIG